MVRKRYTYAFREFISGWYNSTASIVRLLNQMTIDEKLDIMSMNFQQMWYRVYLDSPDMARTNTYFVCKNKFENMFFEDGGVRIRALINRSANSDRHWEIPKGRRHGTNESDLQCAIREFEEETGIEKKHYRVLPRFVRHYNFADGGIRYHNKYYLAITFSAIDPRVQFGLREQTRELVDIRWMSIEDIKLIDRSGRLVRQIRPMLRHLRRRLK